EYPFWILLREARRRPVRIEHINVTNGSAVKCGADPYAGFSPGAVIVVDADRNPAAVAERGNYTQAWAASVGARYTQAWCSGPVRVFVATGIVRGAQVRQGAVLEPRCDAVVRSGSKRGAALLMDQVAEVRLVQWLSRAPGCGPD